MRPVPADAPKSRWDNYLLIEDIDLDAFWLEILSSARRDVLFILGIGFDPRMCIGAERILGSGGSGKRHCLAVEYGDASGEAESQVTANRKRLEGLFSSMGGIETRTIAKRSPEGRRIASSEASRLVDSIDSLADYTDVVIDVSAFPRDVFLTLIAKVLYVFDAASKSGRKSPNLHVLVSEDPDLDRSITPGGVDDDVTFIKAFSGQHGMEATASVPRVWIPILGEGRDIHIRRIFDALQPDEINPLIPWPSRNPRRGDELVGQYRELLFDVLRIEPPSIIYASEANPFQVYREVLRTIVRYQASLSVLGGCKAFVSPLSSKLLSIGALLACYELKFDHKIPVGIPHLTGDGHRMDLEMRGVDNARVISLWVAGECYES